VVSSLLSAFAMFYLATVDAFYMLTHLAHYAEPALDAQARQELHSATVGHVVEIVDGYLLGAVLLTWTERRRPEVQEALIGVLFVLASTAQILLLANDPHGGEQLKDLLAGQILWVSTEQLVRAAVLTALFLLVWFRFRLQINHAGFYVLFAIMVTMSVQLVGVYLVFTTLIVPALATYRHAANRQLPLGYALAVISYLVGLAVSVVTDLPSSAVIVWAMAVLAILLHLTARPRITPDLEDA